MRNTGRKVEGIGWAMMLAPIGFMVLGLVWALWLMIASIL